MSNAYSLFALVVLGTLGVCDVLNHRAIAQAHARITTTNDRLTDLETRCAQ